MTVTFYRPRHARPARVRQALTLLGWLAACAWMVTR
jgi:hypothetical protein